MNLEKAMVAMLLVENSKYRREFGVLLSTCRNFFIEVLWKTSIALILLDVKFESLKD